MSEQQQPAAPAATAPEILRYTAFSTSPDGGNPAGVVLDAGGLDAEARQRIAAEVGYSETAFLTPPPPELAAEVGSSGRAFTIRYHSPEAEVDFCGHATVATAVALAERHGPGNYAFATRAGVVPVTVDDELRATLTSVPPRISDITDVDLTAVLEALRWSPADLDPALPARIAYAGNDHLVLAAATRARLADLDYDFDALRALMLRLGLTTLQLVWRESETVFHVRDPFPVGGVVEDPATGAAAAAFGGYLRLLDLAPDGAVLTLHQGEDMGRPGLLTVTLPEDDPRIHVSGTATALR
ncbi:PhzF family phenazine biosynthesis isomerase [Streptomyces sp. OF3]|uniref:PhzF family phenazine biosynthesis isomerase n=1 Tax=Streptomyces alkaliterrae TaxID=2213162 RepID=A0A7W3WIN4_9ACTN|nr:PhzF family phenazine biosynthesis isomerase [Streptomyces alkaliterrae]MBB1253051.1 PhzF family phenazine biosynthesis isomerase [Streptomyces alkaliterrae]